MGSDLPKQFLKVNGNEIIIHTLNYFEKNEKIDEIYIACINKWIPYLKKLVLRADLSKVKKIFPGGKTGQDSIFIALSEVKKDHDNAVVLIHDGVRPIIDEDLITRNIETVKKYGNSITSSNATETCCLIGNNKNIENILPRDKCIIAKAPQSFYIKDIIKCHKKAIEDNITNAIDSADLMMRYGYNLHYITCSNMNIKITTPIDYYLFKGILNALESMQVIGI